MVATHRSRRTPCFPGRCLAWLVLSALATFLVGCIRYPTRAANRSPHVRSVVASPDTLGPGDSTTVTVTATDPDGDALVYDWGADGYVLIAGSYDSHLLYNTFSSSHVFYRSPGSPVGDSALVAGTARDLRGGSDTRIAIIRLRN